MKKILVVDNDQLMTEFIADLLMGEGHEVKTAGDGLAALEVLRAYTPNFIFTDLLMPNMDGKELCRQVRSMNELRDTAIYILSSATPEEDVNVSDLGASGFIAKGSFNTMAEQILSVLD